MRCRTTASARLARRAGVTLIELLVVMAIIATLASLVVGAVFTLRESQMKSFSETTIQKLASSLDQQWKAVLDQARSDTVPGWAVNMAGGDLRRARAIYMKGRLAQEFPMTFAKAINPGGAVVSVANLQPKPTYLAACSGVTPNAAWESSALLYLALSQGRAGMSAASGLDDIIEPTALQTVTAGGKQFRILVDAWGNPLRFYNFPTANVELNQPPYVNLDITNFPLNGRDPVDPEGTLYSPNWAAVTSPNLRGLFQATFHALNPVDQRPTASYLIPVIASAGKDGFWGIDATTMAISDPDQAGDNLYSYRLRRSGARGD
ncbi:MAG: type II secretion system protein [Gemmataceae bacterium]